MARPPAPAENAKTKTFKVVDGFSIGGYDGKRKDGGDDIELTHAQAVYFKKLGAIDVAIEDYSDEPAAADTSETSETPETDSAGTPNL